MRARWLCISWGAVLTMAPCLTWAQVTAPPPPPQQNVSPAQAAAATKAAKEAAATEQATAPLPQNTPVVLDSVVAVINGDVLLESDVEEERRFDQLELLPPGENTNVHAAQHLITQTLILQQMKEEGAPDSGVTPADVDKVIDELKHQLPACRPDKCISESGWTSYLATLGLTPQEVYAHWRERLIILNYLNLRFRSGIRIPRSQVRDYYEKTFVPQFTAKHMKPPTLASVSTRISELLLQQQVTAQINDWEKTLRQQGSVRILVPAYGESNTNAELDQDYPGGA